MMNPDSTNPTAAELLAEASWAKDLAHRLVGDAAAVDDVVQEALLAAVRRPPHGGSDAEGESLRPWFASVVTNAARMGRRGAARRERREQQVARPEELPSAAELVAKTEAQRTLVDTVLRLDEPYRSTILLRYFEDLSSADIARRQGIPPGTVRWRLAEGLKRLRSELDAEYGGDHRAWCAVLLPLVHDRSDAAFAVGTSSLTTLGLTLMSMKTVAVLGLAGLLWFLADSVGMWSGGDSDYGLGDENPETVSFRPLPKPDPEQPTVAETRQPVDPPSKIGVPAPVAQQEVVVRARLVDQLGVAIANARMVRADWMGKLGSPAASTPSDHTGRVELRWMVAVSTFAESKGISAEFVVRHPRFANERRRSVLHRDRDLDLGDIVLHPGGAITGRVIDERGAALEGVEVSVGAATRKRSLAGGIVSSEQGLTGGARTRSDTAGAFTLRGLSAGFVRVDAKLGEREGHSGPVEVRAGMESYDLVLIVLRQRSKDTVITGLVLDPQGNPVPRADLDYTYRALMRKGSGSVTVDRNGRFEIENVKKGDYTLLAADPRRRFGEAEKAGVEPGDFVVLRLPVARRFQLELRDDAGQPITVATIGIQAAERSTTSLQYLPRIVGTTGVYPLHLPSIPFRLVLAAPGFEERGFGPYDPGTMKGDSPRITLRLERAPVLQGRVWVAGAPATDIEVGLHPRARQRTRRDGFPVWLRTRPVVRDRTDRDGRFVLTVREAGPFFVRAFRDGSAIAEIGPITDHDRELKIVLDAGGTIRGHVRSTKGGRTAGTIVGISRGDGAARTQRVGADGAFEFTLLTPGKWMVSQRAEEILPGNTSSTSSLGAPYREVPTVCEVFAGKVTSHDLWIDGAKPVGELRGRLVLGDVNLAGWKVDLLPAASRGVEAPIATGQLDRHGRFVVPLKGLGEHRLVIADDSVAGPFGRRLVTPLRLVAGTNHWDLTLATTAVRGTGAPRDAESQRPLVLLWEGRGEHEGVTYLHTVIGDAAGRFHLPAEPVGPSRFVKPRNPEQIKAAGGRKGWVTLQKLNSRRGVEATVDLGR